MRRLHYNIRTLVNRRNMADQQNQDARAVLPQRSGPASSRAPVAHLPENPTMNNSIASSGIPFEDANNLPANHQPPMTMPTIESAHISLGGFMPGERAQNSLDRLSDEAVDTQYTPYHPPPEIPVAGASGAEDVVTPPIELPLTGVSTVDISTSDVTTAI